MTTFYFNEILPEQSERDVQWAFEQTIRQIALLSGKTELELTRPIITGTSPNNILICGKSLTALIDSCPNRDLRTEAQFIFTQNLIASHENALPNDTVNSLLEASYTFHRKGAMNLAIAYHMKWPLVSLPLADYLEQDELSVESDVAEILSIPNYYAQQDTSYIERWLLDEANEGAEGLDLLKSLFVEKGVIITNTFNKNWNNAPEILRKLAINRFRLAIENKMIFPVKSDDDLIKKCEVKGSEFVYELRQLGSGLRIYFGYTTNGKIILASLHTKAESRGREQTMDINSAAREIRKAIAILSV